MMGQTRHVATSNDLRRILGKLDHASIVEILALAPSVADVEEAMKNLASDENVLAGRDHRLSGAARRIVEILTAAEEEDEHLREP